MATGDLFRENLEQQTPVGLMAKGFMDRGMLVPDEVVCQMVRGRLEDEAIHCLANDRTRSAFLRLLR